MKHGVFLLQTLLSLLMMPDINGKLHSEVSWQLADSFL